MLVSHPEFTHRVGEYRKTKPQRLQVGYMFRSSPAGLKSSGTEVSCYMGRSGTQDDTRGQRSGQGRKPAAACVPSPSEAGRLRRLRARQPHTRQPVSAALAASNLASATTPDLAADIRRQFSLASHLWRQDRTTSIDAFVGSRTLRTAQAVRFLILRRSRCRAV